MCLEGTAHLSFGAGRFIVAVGRLCVARDFGTGAPSGLTWALGQLTSMLHGVASALTLDEFALWLNLRDVYWEREGRESIEAIALFAGLLGAGISGGSLFRGIGKEVTK
jgi:hypothetical protein